MKKLQITNGDGAANVMKEAGIEGEILPWRDPMHHGPFPANNTLPELAAIRAEYLSGGTLNFDDIKADFIKRDLFLYNSLDYEEVTLWFEHDLLDQLQILQILDYFHDHPHPNLNMICINAFEGRPNFRGIGELNPTEMASLLDKKIPISDAQLSLAKNAWAAFRSDNINDIIQIIKSDTAALPFLKAALNRHLEEFPQQNGLTRTETQIMQLVLNGINNPVQLFIQNMDFEAALFIGDWPSYRLINKLCQSGLLSTDGDFLFPPMHDIDLKEFKKQSIKITQTGKDILQGKKTAHDLIERDLWLGGIHIKE